MSQDGMMTENMGEIIQKVVRMDHTRTAHEALVATGRNLYTDDEIVANMPTSINDGEEVKIIFFKVGRWLTDEELAQEYELRGLRPADPYSQAKANEDDPLFGDEHPNGTHWKHNDNWCYATFARWFGLRGVGVHCKNSQWRDDWWFGGFHK
jgi:hypothetical protein